MYVNSAAPTVCDSVAYYSAAVHDETVAGISLQSDATAAHASRHSVAYDSSSVKSKQTAVFDANRGAPLGSVCSGDITACKRFIIFGQSVVYSRKTCALRGCRNVVFMSCRCVAVVKTERAAANVENSRSSAHTYTVTAEAEVQRTRNRCCRRNCNVAYKTIVSARRQTVCRRPRFEGYAVVLVSNVRRSVQQKDPHHKQRYNSYRYQRSQNEFNSCFFHTTTPLE